MFIELKGTSADEQMADDVAAMIEARGMQQEVVVISLKYALVDYFSTQYPDIPTGLLYFASYGSASGLNCDYLILEEESATSSAIGAIHEAGKKAIVWTVNSETSMQKFLDSEADAIITDNVAQALQVRTQLNERSEMQRLWSYLWTF